MSDILCVTNRKLCRRSLPERLKSIAACRPAGVILREKDLPPEEYKGLARQAVEICKKYGVPCILHSFVDIALELRAGAIHLPLQVLRSMSQEEKDQFQVLGASCHSAADAMEAEKLGCTYICAGHVFETSCKKGLPGRGIPFLREVCASVSIPVYAIGGIDQDNIQQVRSAGAAGACLMSSLMTCPDVSELLRSMEGKNEI